MKIGKLRHRIEIQAKTPTQDSYGEITYSWATADTVWAQVMPLKGRELEHAQQIQAETDYKMIIRYNSTVKHRVVYDSRTFEVNVILNIGERDIYQEIYCKEIL